MTTRTDLYDERDAICRMVDERCPNHGDDIPEAPCADHSVAAAPRPDKTIGCRRCAKHFSALKEVIRKLRRLNRARKRQVQTDSLTGLLSRRAIEETIMAEMQRRERYDGPLALFFIDVDQFKDINDTHSHVAGDHALREVARALTKASRVTDKLGRMGGDEFLLVSLTDREGAAALAERIQEELSRADICYGGQALRLTVSIGVAVAEPGVATCYADLLHLAATALGEAKKSGRNCYVLRWVEASPREG